MGFSYISRYMRIVGDVRGVQNDTVWRRGDKIEKFDVIVLRIVHDLHLHQNDPAIMPDLPVEYLQLYSNKNHIFM